LGVVISFHLLCAFSVLRCAVVPFAFPSGSWL
jgi:hypothetical protein